MKKQILLTLLLFVLCMTSASAQIQRPRLIVGLVVDQMRWDYLYFYNDLYCNDGLKRLLNEGYSCENNMINYVPTVTAIGHASIYTGTGPALHGIAGNNFYEDGKRMYCVEDKSVTPVGTNSEKEKMSPRNLLATTIGDQLKLATDFKSRVFGVALKDRAAILPAGHAADAAYWYDKSTFKFISSSYYMQELPEWVVKFNQDNFIPKDVLGIPTGINLTFKMAEALLENEKLGQTANTDMLAVSISSTDIIGHATGTRGEENVQAYLQLDKDIAHFLSTLDRLVGKGNYLLFLSADHGAVHNPNFLKKHRLPAAGLPLWEEVKPLNQQLQRIFPGADKLIIGVGSNSIYLNHEQIVKLNLPVDKIKQEIKRILLKDKRICYVVDRSNIVNEPIPQFLRERIVLGYHHRRSGDLLVVTQPNVVPGSNASDYVGTSHGVWNPYDAHIPLVFFGWNIPHGQTNAETCIVDIAPTVCAMLHIQMPNACIGKPIVQITER